MSHLRALAASTLLAAVALPVAALDLGTDATVAVDVATDAASGSAAAGATAAPGTSATTGGAMGTTDSTGNAGSTGMTGPTSPGTATGTTGTAGGSARVAARATVADTFPDLESLETDPANAFVGNTLVTSDNEEVGRITEVRVDTATGRQVLCGEVSATLEATDRRVCMQVPADAVSDGSLRMSMTAQEFHELVGARVH